MSQSNSSIVLIALAILFCFPLAGSADNSQSQDKPSPVITAGEDGFSIKSADGDFRLLFHGYVHFDGRFFPATELPAGTDTFLLRRVRPILDGTFYKYFSFRIMPDFGEGKFVLQDAYLDAAIAKQFKIRAGKFKSPVGLERLQSANDLLFVERALPTSLAPNRDVGVGFIGDLAGGTVNYTVALLNGVPDAVNGDTDTDNNKDVAGRIFTTPIKSDHATLGFGLAATYGNQDGTPSLTGLPSYKTVGQRTFFSYRADGTQAGTVVADGARKRFSPQGYFYCGPFGAIAEYVHSSQEVRKDTISSEIQNSSWQLAAGYFLTGEKATYQRAKVLNPLNPEKGDWGAFQLKARFAQLEIDEDAFPVFADHAKSASEAKTFGAGITWLLNNNMKFMLDYNRTWFQGGGSPGDRETENLVNFRLQLAY